MNKSKTLVLLAVIGLLLLSLCGCNNTEPVPEATKTGSAETSVSTTAGEVPADSSNAETENVQNSEAEATASSEEAGLPSQGENDLELMTLPQNDSDSSENAETTVSATEPVADPPKAETTTEAQRIELPFVPAN
ncbi:MAG: hypothetical protein IKK10_05065 [Clostridia bacterium]|nr:hypothetical protein [Clostridia bacterium]